MGAHGQGQRAQRRRRHVTRTGTLLLTAAALAAVLLFATGPRAPLSLAPRESGSVLRGAFHIHTTRSDGTLPKPDVAAAAARAGLQFAIFTDHGDGTRPPEPPAYIHGVLCLDAVEISTNDGHYIAIDMPAAPYPLAGDADAVAEDVARLGGFGVAAHPSSPREDLAWSDWSVPIDGLEWLNADSEWRDERRLRLVRILLDYLWRPAPALATLLDRPEGAFAQWDRLTATRPIVGLAGHDAHGGFGPETGDPPRSRRLHVPSYDASFRTFSLYVTVADGVTGDAANDARHLIEAIRHGRVFTAIDAIAGPASLDFTATAGEAIARGGGELPVGREPARFSVRAAAPPGATTVLLRNGVVVAEGGGALDHVDASSGAFRVEVHAPGAPGSPPVPWLVSNPIYRLPQASAKASLPQAPIRTETTPFPAGVWQVESSPGSSGTLDADDGSVSLSYRLGPDRSASQFVALAIPLVDVPAGANQIAFRGRADRPMRISVQLRFAGQNDERWRRSVYLESVERDVVIPTARLRPAGNTGPLPAVAQATSVLFVVDLTNARAGEEGYFTLSGVALQETGR